MFIGLLFLYGAVEGFIPPFPTAFSIGRGEWVRASSLVIPRLTLEEIDALSTLELKRELRQRETAYSDCFEKSDLVFRLKESILHPEKCKQKDHKEEGTNQITVEEEDEVPEETQNGEGRRHAVQKEVQLMKTKDIKAELLDRGVSTEGLFEKTEFVEVLVNARMKDDMIPNGSSTQQEMEKKAEEEERDSSYKDVQVTRMKHKEPRQPSDPRNSGLGGNPFDRFREGNPFGRGNPFGGGKNPFGL